MSFDYNVERYTFDDLKRLFDVKSGESVTKDELDTRIKYLTSAARRNKSDDSLVAEMEKFLIIAKEKFLIHIGSQHFTNKEIYPMTERLQSEFIPNKMLDRNEHTIIENTPNIQIPKVTKYININSADRDIVAWPVSSQFEVTVPDALRDVESARLYDFNFNCFMFNFTHFYQNTKLRFKYSSNEYIVTIPDGNYSSVDITTVLSNLMNDAVNVSDAFTCSIDLITKRFSITCTSSFELLFDSMIMYENDTEKHTHLQVKNIYQLPKCWGLGYFLGFHKQKYESVLDGSVHTITSSRVVSLDLNQNVFLELDGFNHSQQTQSVNGIVKGYFSRIPILSGKSNDVGGYELANVSFERVSKLKFRLRFHNGILVDLQDQDFDFTLMFTCKK